MSIYINIRNKMLRYILNYDIIIIDRLNGFLKNREVEAMKINKITVGGFRNIRNVELTFDNILALVSLNGYGKSNLLTAIDFGIDFIRNDQEIKESMMSWIKGVPLNKEIAAYDYNIEFEMTTTIDSKVYKVVYGYKFRWVRDDNTGTRIIGEWLKVKLDEKNQKFNNYIVRAEDKAFYRTSESGRCNNKINIAKNELIINKLKAYDFLYYIELIRKINNLNMYIERHLDASLSYEPDPVIRTDMKVLQIGNGMSIQRVIYHLKKQFPDKYELLINSFVLLFPKITDVIVEELETKKNFQTSLPDDLPLRIDNQLYSLKVIDSDINQPISFESISDGAKRVFLILTSILLADINGYSIIAIEEPENSIHPGLLQGYLRIISQFIVNCNVIITSHSPYIVQYLEPDNVYIGLPHLNGVAEFSRIRQSAQKAIINDAKSLGVSMGDYIFELLSGSEEDFASLEDYLEERNNE